METKSPSNGRKIVRVVARVRPSTNPASTRSILVHKPIGEISETVSISSGVALSGSKGSYKLDYCYEENDTMGSIFKKEISPLISTIFEGKDANVIAHGARCSGKTHLIQGNEREPGLTVLTMSEMLSMAEERKASISVSFYDISQETVYDLLDQEKRVVSVLEGVQGKIQLKGLSRILVKSLSEFQTLYFGLKKTQKPSLRSHKGVMIHVTTGNINSGSLGRMNILDMAGYEDSRKQNSDLAPLEIARINKSIYALQNVMYALNANESHVPYRESKITHMLKDCLQGCNKTLLITCLHREFSQDSFYMLNLASRICLGGNRAMTNLTKKKIEGSAKSASFSSTAQKRQTPLVASTTTKKQTEIRGNVTAKKTQLNAAASAIKGRKLFSEGNDLVKWKNKTKKEISTSEVILSVQASSTDDEVCSSLTVTNSQSLVEECYSSGAILSKEVVDTTDKETHLNHEENFSGASHCDGTSTDKAQVVAKDDNDSVIEKDLTLVNEGEKLEKENNNLLASEPTSPPLSMRLQELSNTLKSLCKTSNQSSVAEKYQTALTETQVEQVSEHNYMTMEAGSSAELRTPEKTMPSSIGCSPWKTFSAQSSKLKNSAIGEYLKFLNTAGKEDLKRLKGIGEKRATYIVELREESPEPFKTLDDLKDIGLSEKQVKGLLKKEIGDFF